MTNFSRFFVFCQYYTTCFFPNSYNLQGSSIGKTIKNCWITSIWEKFNTYLLFMQPDNRLFCVFKTWEGNSKNEQKFTNFLTFSYFVDISRDKLFEFLQITVIKFAENDWKSFKLILAGPAKRQIRYLIKAIEFYKNFDTTFIEASLFLSEWLLPSI